MQDQRKLVPGWAGKSNHELQLLCDPLWRKLDKSEKSKYKKAKREYREKMFNHSLSNASSTSNICLKKVTIENIETPDVVWISNVEEAEKINKEISKIALVPLERKNIAIGTVALCKFSEDGELYRCKVTGIMEDEAVLKIRYLDYGNCEVVSENKLFHAPASVIKLSPCASKVKISGMEGVKNTEKNRNKVLKKLDFDSLEVSLDARGYATFYVNEEIISFKRSVRSKSDNVKETKLVDDFAEVTISSDLATLECNSVYKSDCPEYESLSNDKVFPEPKIELTICPDVCVSNGLETNNAVSVRSDNGHEKKTDVDKENESSNYSLVISSADQPNVEVNCYSNASSGIYTLESLESLLSKKISNSDTELFDESNITDLNCLGEDSLKKVMNTNDSVSPKIKVSLHRRESKSSFKRYKAKKQNQQKEAQGWKVGDSVIAQWPDKVWRQGVVHEIVHNQALIVCSDSLVKAACVDLNTLKHCDISVNDLNGVGKQLVEGRVIVHKLTTTCDDVVTDRTEFDDSFEKLLMLFSRLSPVELVSPANDKMLLSLLDVTSLLKESQVDRLLTSLIENGFFLHCSLDVIGSKVLRELVRLVLINGSSFKQMVIDFLADHVDELKTNVYGKEVLKMLIGFV